MRTQTHAFYHRRITAFLFLVFLVCASGFSQQKENAYTKVAQQIGQDQVLVQGTPYTYNARYDISHPYYNKDAFENGYIVLRNRKYESLKLKYDLFEQCIVVANSEHSTQFAYSPPEEYISEFLIDSVLFKKLMLQDKQERFCQVVYENKIGCYYYWFKSRNESHHNGTFSAFNYHKQKRKSYLKNSGIIYGFKSKKEFIELFPEAKRETIKKYMSSNKISLTKASEKEMSELILFCENILLGKSE